MDTGEQLAQAFKNHAQGRNYDWKGEGILAAYLGWWFEERCQFKFRYNSILQYFNKLMYEALEHFRQGDDSITTIYRTEYLNEIELSEVSNAFDISYGGMYRGPFIFSIESIIEKVLDQRIKIEFSAYMWAQDNVLSQKLQEFNLKVYRKGLFKLFNQCSCSAMSGEFGSTKLMTFMTAGRVLMTFLRKDSDLSVSFVATDEDPLGIRTGVQSVYATFIESLQLIQDVIDNWPDDEDRQREIFQADESIFIG